MQNNDGYSALMVASVRGHNETVELLVNHGAHVNMQNNNRHGYTALMYARGHTKVVEF